MQSIKICKTGYYGYVIRKTVVCRRTIYNDTSMKEKRSGLKMSWNGPGSKLMNMYELQKKVSK